jgi:hypothetical protein
MRIILILVFLLQTLSLVAQSSEEDSVSKAIEIDTVNKKISPGKILLGASATIGIPLTIGLTILSLSPPSYVLLFKDGKSFNGLAFETAIGYGDTTRFRFSDTRIIFQYAYIENLKSRVSIALTKDGTLGRFGRGEIFGYGFSTGFWFGTNFKNISSMGIEVSLWVGNAMNIPYLFLFPQHHLFIKLKRGFILNPIKQVSELNIGLSSSITLKK